MLGGMRRGIACGSGGVGCSAFVVFVGSLTGWPRRHRYKDGRLLRHDVPDILNEWRDDSVGFFSASDLSWCALLQSTRDAHEPRHPNSSSRLLILI
jgi:uncharacterized protein YcsI (UPF0317 family)